MNSSPLRSPDARVLPLDGLTHVRAITHDLHHELDVRLSKLNLGNRDNYAVFLAAMYRGLARIEEWLVRNLFVVELKHQSSTRTELILDDLDELEHDPGPMLDANWLPEEPTTAEVLGTLYVLEGSRMGAKVLIHQTASGLPSAYLSDKNALLPWRELQERIRAVPPPQFDPMGNMAISVFEHFILAVKKTAG